MGGAPLPCNPGLGQDAFSPSVACRRKLTVRFKLLLRADVQALVIAVFPHRGGQQSTRSLQPAAAVALVHAPRGLTRFRFALAARPVLSCSNNWMRDCACAWHPHPEGRYGLLACGHPGTSATDSGSPC